MMLILHHPEQDFPCRAYSNTQCIHFPRLQVRQALSQIYDQSRLIHIRPLAVFQKSGITIDIKV